MNLDNFKPTWNYYKIVNQMDSIDSVEILDAISDFESVDYQKFSVKFLPNSVLYGLLILFCQSC